MKPVHQEAWQWQRLAEDQRKLAERKWRERTLSAKDQKPADFGLFSDQPWRAIGEVARMFACDNGQFDRERFLRACEPGRNVRARS